MTALHRQPFSPAPHIERRARLMQQLLALGGGVALIPTAPEVVRNHDAHYDFRPASTFFYLTGFSEPEAVLVLVAQNNACKSILFCRDKDESREIWDGYRFGPHAAQSQFAVDEALPIAELATHLPALLTNQPTIFAPLLGHNALNSLISDALQTARSASRSGASAPSAVRDIYALTDEMRLLKDDSEINWLRAAGQISAAGHIRAMQACRVGMVETDLEAEILYSFARAGAQHASYNSIVATGANACVLHYRAGLSTLKDGDLCLIDAGAEYGCYAGDITRTFPVNGRFSAAQRAVYEVVLAAQQAAIDATRAGVRFNEPHDAAVRVLTQGMLDLGLLDKTVVGNVDDAIASRAYQKFYMHRTGHWLGLDVHDCGAYSSGQDNGQPVWRTLQERMVLTIEPGLYIRPSSDVDEAFWNIGIRIEDDALVTANGCELLTRDVPVTINEIEYLMQHEH
ncbi:MAG: aminopeptidase P N-terminal domain-containing protein [Formosimonas sp.]